VLPHRHRAPEGHRLRVDVVEAPALRAPPSAATPRAADAGGLRALIRARSVPIRRASRRALPCAAR
jgi:hypothetical protein